MNNFIYPLIDNPFSDEDINKAIKVIKSNQLTLSKYTFKFEKNFTNKINTKFYLMDNSGSSANLLAFQCLINPYRKKDYYQILKSLYHLYVGRHHYGQ